MADQIMETAPTTSKYGLVTGQTYRNITIYTSSTEIYIISASGMKYPFATVGEARGFIDSWYLMQAAVDPLT